MFAERARPSFPVHVIVDVDVDEKLRLLQVVHVHINVHVHVEGIRTGDSGVGGKPDDCECDAKKSAARCGACRRDDLWSVPVWRPQTSQTILPKSVGVKIRLPTV